MPKSVLLVGQGSQLARSVLKSVDGEASDGLVIQSVSHDIDWNALDLKRYDVILNMAYDPLYMREAYDEARDFDLFIARKASKAGCHYIMLSTRRVYGLVAASPIQEDFPTAPIDHYGRNKLRTETAVQSLLGGRCTILRVGNVFDFELGRHTFFGIALKNLKSENRITLDVSPFVKRDFIPVEDFAAIMRLVLGACPPGLFNLGSGHATEVGKIAVWLIEGYGKGELLVVSPEHRDAFELDRSKLKVSLGSRVGPLSAPSDVRRRCLEIGSRLKHE